ncbi:methyltransferase domain-containing protein [Candidatus Dojkabacteria bacterium]|uniref:Methyltransferase domain-containing protein n=1 Tax=Candidatus Dojkabacteria bacterium TaxID=2099670 RepID=A0A955RJ31_9BACT|nr:methyltransferase domain-containing protein [Candidatus Dojkabacteria bacterium]
MPANIKLPEKPQTEENQSKDKNSRHLIQNITFFGDSAIPSDNPIYRSVWEASKHLAEQGYTIVDGGGPGIMKAATDGAESVNGNTIAIYWQPKLASFFEGKNLANITDESETASNYMIRTLQLIDYGDAYVVCKGGTGTVSEFGMVWALSKLYYGCHKPVILFGSFWDNIIESFRTNMNIDEIELGVLYQANSGDEIIKILQEHEEKTKHCSDKVYEGTERAFVLGGRSSEITSKAYNQIAADYHSEHAGQLVAQEQLDEFISLVNPPAQVLDIGTGPGFDAQYLSRKYSVTGLEISKKMVDIAQFECPEARILHEDIVTCHLEPNKYKGVWARGSLHHVAQENQLDVFKKISESLVQHGIFYLIVREGEGEVTEKDRDYEHTEHFIHLYTKEEINDLADKSGFEVISITENQRSHKWLAAVLKKK